MLSAELGVVVEDGCGEFDFCFCLCDEFAHLQGQRLCVVALVGAQDFCGPGKESCAIFDGGLRPLAEGCVGGVDRLVDFLRGGGVKGLDGFTGVGVCCCVRHVGYLISQSLSRGGLWLPIVTSQHVLRVVFHHQ